MMIPVLIARMNSEERLLQSQLGQQYDDHRSRTSRLIPGIYEPGSPPQLLLPGRELGDSIS